MTLYRTNVWATHLRVLYLTLLVIALATCTADGYGIAHGKQIYLKALLEKYGSNGIIVEAEFYHFSSSLGLDPDHNTEGSTCNSTTDHTCAQMCLGYMDIFRRFSVGSQLNVTGLDDSLSAMVYSLQDPSCHHTLKDGKIQHAKPSSGEAWGLGIGSASVIVFISNIGVFFKPCMKSRGFQRIMYFCVALAVGTLGGTGLLVLIPESLGMTGLASPIPDYRQKLVMALTGIYVFFVIERCINMGAEHRKRKNLELKVSEHEPLEKTDVNGDVHGHSHGAEGDVATVAWTLLLGDALHNFADGLAMGAAYTESIAVGVSVSLAILSEELPHELGDIAILLHSGMTIKRALFLNFLAAVTIYGGLVVGIIVGENTDTNTYIFGFAGGLFVYIALADMIPEMNNQAKIAADIGQDSKLTVFVHQNLGLLLGFAIVIMLSFFGQYIVI